jgi:hypothetical protein
VERYSVKMPPEEREYFEMRGKSLVRTIGRGIDGPILTHDVLDMEKVKYLWAFGYWKRSRNLWLPNIP